jgi:hypothetical protein
VGQQGRNRKKAARRRSAAKSTPRTSARKPESRLPWREIALVVLSALAVVADLIGIISGTPVIQLVLGSILVLVGVWTFFSSQQRSLRHPRSIGSAIAGAGVIVLAIATYGMVSDQRDRRRTEVAEVCAAAQDYDESYMASGALWATSGRSSTSTDQADARAADNLERMSRASNRIEDESVKVLVHDIRMRANLGDSRNNNDVAASIANLKQARTSLSVLLQLCTEAGVPVTRYNRLPVDPTVEAACRYLDRAMSFGTDNPAQWTEEQHHEFFALINMLLYHGLNSDDDAFARKADAFAGTLGTDMGANFDRIGPMYGHCVARGFMMKLANEVPPKYVTVD